MSTADLVTKWDGFKAIHLWSAEPDAGPGLFIPVLRRAAVALASFATNGCEGRVMGDPVIQAITEGRIAEKDQAGRPISCCGDLPHWVLEMLGVRDERIVNRTDDGGDTPWRAGINISRLVYATGKAVRNPSTAIKPMPGDILALYDPTKPNSDHVCVVGTWDQPTRNCTTYDYGQFNMKAGKPSGEMKTRPIRETGTGELWVGDRRVRMWVDLPSMVFDESACVPGDFDGGVLDDNPY